MTNDLEPNAYNLVDSEGEPVSSRLPNGAAMKAMVDEMITDDLQAASARAAIQGMVNGNKPLSDQKLKDDGQSYRSNWNDRQAESIIDTRCAADFNMLFDTGRTIEVSFTPGFFTDQRVADSYAARIAQAFTHVFTREPQIVEATQRAIRDRVELGLGFLIFPDKFDWRPKAIRRGRCFFNRTASANCSDMEVFYALDTMTVAEAYSHIEKAEAADRAGWYIDRMKKALVDVFYRGAQRKAFQNSYVLMYEDLQQRIRSNDPGYYSKQYEAFPIVHGFVQERTGKASHYIQPYQSDSPDWIFESFECASGMENLVIPLPYDFGDGTLASVKGVGHRIFALCTESNRMLMHMMDVDKLGSSLLIKNLGGGDGMAFSMMRAGPVTIFDKNMELQQTAYSPRMDSSFTMRRVLHDALNTNTGMFRAQANPEESASAVPTAEQVRTEASKEVKTENDRAFLTYLRWDALVQQVFQRLISKNSRHSASPKAARKGAELFWTMCEALGVPSELFTEHADKIQVRATRAIGSGSPYVRQQNLLMLKNTTYQSMDERGRRQLDREIGSVLVGSDNVGKFIPEDSNQIPSDVHSHAQLELNDMYEGTMTLVGADQQHGPHITVPLAAMIQEAQAFQQDPTGGDIKRTANLFRSGIPHIQRHIEYLATDPLRKAEVEGYIEQIQQIIPIAQSVLQYEQQIAEAEQKRIAQLEQENMQLKQSMDEVHLLDQRERLKIQLEHQRSAENTINMNENRDSKTQTANQLKIEREGLETAIKQHRLQMEESERMMKMRLAEMESMAKVQREAMKAQ